MMESIRTRAVVVLVLSLALSACQGGSKSDEVSADTTTDAKIEATSDVLQYAEVQSDGSAVAGAALEEHAVVALGEVLQSPAEYAGKVVRLHANIDEVCQASGCWMIVREGDHSSRVTFKDYGFFVPKDAAGRRVEMDVEVSSETMSVEEARHYASETEGGDPDSITEAVETVSIVATGVRILPPPGE